MALVPFPSKTAVRNPDDEDPDRDLDDVDDEGGAGKMSFLEHLDELRKRIIWAVASIGLGFVIAILFLDSHQLTIAGRSLYVPGMLEFIMRPMQEMLPAGQKLIYTEPGEAFFLQIKIALIAGLLIASPLVFLQLWLFIAPGLYSHEKKYAIPFIVMSTFFFTAGAVFAHYVVFPIVWRFFVGTGSGYEFIQFEPRVEPAFALYLRLILAMGLTFELPTVVLFLARMGLVTAGFMLRHIKFAFLLIVIAAAVLSPDGGGVGMLAMGGPVMLLYIFSIALAWIFGKKKRSEPDLA
jgi:sec-independent protein translocase protein TatC